MKQILMGGAIYFKISGREANYAIRIDSILNKNIADKAYQDAQNMAQNILERYKQKGFEITEVKGKDLEQITETWFNK